MNEALLQFIWQYSIYNPGNLMTITGEKVQVVQPGKLNRNAGPDFTDARVRVGNTLLAGNVEIHINSSDWLKHGHEGDASYQNIILHVVYNNDWKGLSDHIPVLEIAPHISQDAITQYSGLVKSLQPIPCSSRLHEIRDLTKESWLNRLLAERWEQKLAEWQDLLDKSAGDWRNLLYWRMASNFGFKVNATPFLMLAQAIPLNVLARHHGSVTQIEALLFGTAGMLDGTYEEDYPNELQKEYQYLKKKYKLLQVPLHLWKFLRMRPANFPTIRIAQFAALVHKSVHLFSNIVELDTIREIQPLLDVTAGEYWDTHFVFDELQKKPSEKKLGMSSVYNIIINTVAPIQFLYAANQGVSDRKEKALQLLDTVPAESNNILNLWKETGWKPKNAAQSQAFIQLYNHYCSHKKCLDCTIGHTIMKTGLQPVTPS